MTENIEESIAKYEHFINNVLKEDLRVLEQRLLQINAEITDLTQQRHALKVITDKKIHPTGFKTQVNLGCNFFMEATVPDSSTLFINIGLNHFLEFSSEEACKYLDVRIKAFEEKAQELQNKAAETKAHIKLMLFSLGELHGMGDPAGQINMRTMRAAPVQCQSPGNLKCSCIDL